MTTYEKNEVDWQYWRDLYRTQNKARGDCGADSCRVVSLAKWLWK